NLKSAADIVDSEAHKSFTVRAEFTERLARFEWHFGKCAEDKHHQACQSEAFGPAEFGNAYCYIAVFPLRPRACVEQHTDDGQIEFRAGAGHGILELFGHDFDRIKTGLRDEVPPARMKRNIQRRVSLLRRSQRAFRRFRQASQIDAKVRQLV